MKPVRRSVVALSAMVVLVVIQAAADPTGLLALFGWSGAALRFDLGVWPLAPALIFLPVLLVFTWWATIRAGDRFWTHAAGLTLAVLVAQAAACFFMVWDLAAAGWAAGFVAAKAVPAALIVAAVTRWFGGRTAPQTHVQGPAWPAAALFAAVTPLLAGLWWTGAAYAPGIPAARFDRGALSVITAMIVLAIATAVFVRLVRARVPGILGGWIAALLACGTVGLVQALFGLIVDGGFRGDIWPLMVAYLTIADGLAFGASLGWIVGLSAVVTDRVRAGRPARGPQLLVASVAALALIATLAVPATSGASAAQTGAQRAASAPPAGFLRAEGTRITDGEANQVLLRGVNVNQLVDFYQPRSEVPATRPLTEDDFVGIAKQGFNVVRLNISWSALEPKRGALDADYLERIEQAVRWAKDHEIYTVLDMHQDSWWNGPSAGETACRPGTEPMWGYDGAPEWATITDGAPRCQFTGRDISPAGNRAFQHFYFDTDGVQTALAETWGKLAEHFSDERMVAGFDLLNEPGFGETAPVTTSHLLGRFYERAIAEIRAAGAEQIVFVEPSIFWSGMGFDSGPTPGFADDRNIVFSPHLYAESITMDRDLGIPPIVSLERQFTLALRVADEYAAPLWSGEYGYWGDDDDVLQRLSRYADAEDEHVLGSAYWVWKQACGDPQNGIGPVGNALMMQDCETGGDAPPKEELLQILSRAYPRSAPGVVDSLEADGATLAMTGTTPERGCGLEVWIPGSAKPELEGVGLSELEVNEVSGGWLVTACAAGAYALSSVP